MIPRLVVVLLALMGSVALAGNDGRIRVARRPVVSANAVSPGAPLDRSAIAAYPAVAPGSAQAIAGQCFVVTDGGQRINLSQVEVRIYPQREFEWYAQEIGARSRARFEAMKAIACPANFAELALDEMDRSLAATAVLQHDLYIVWQTLPAADASTTTDADGRFAVTHHVAAPFVVFASASRTFGGETEYYRWQIPSSVITNPMQVALSNDRLR